MSRKSSRMQTAAHALENQRAVPQSSSSSSNMQVDDATEATLSRKRKSAASATNSAAQQQDKRSKMKVQQPTDSNSLKNAASSSAVAPRPPSSFPISAIGDFLEFLTLRRLHIAAQLSKQWYHAVKTAAPLEKETYFHKLNMIPPGSAVARHVSVFECPLPASVFRSISNLSSRLPNLHSIQIDFRGENSIGQLVLPASLQSFTADVDLCDVEALGLQLVGLSNLRSLALKINMSRHDSYHKLKLTCFSPHPFPLLESLRIDFSEWCNSRDEKRVELFSASMIEFIRQSKLIDLSVSMGPPHLLHKLFEQITAKSTPCPLLQAGRLQFIQRHAMCMLYAPLLKVLAKFPSIQSFGSEMHSVTEPEEMQLLSHLPNLTELDFECRAGCEVSSIVAACQQCPRLTQLKVEHLGFTSDDLRDCLSCLPRLTSLTLFDCSINDISSLQDYGLPQRLIELEIHCCNIPLQDVTDYILPLRKLEHLALGSACTAELPASLLDQLYDLPQLVSWDLESQEAYLARRGWAQ